MIRSTRLIFNLQGSLKKGTVALSNQGCMSYQHRHASKKAEDSKSFAMNLFRGKIETEQVFPYPEVLDAEQEETLQAILDPTVQYFEEVNDAFKNDQLSHVEPESLAQLKALGAFGLQIPEELGGIGLTNTQYGRLTEVVGANDLGVGITLGAHQSIGFKGILLFGTPEQKEKYLPLCATAEKIACFCLTEPTSGSDASSIRTRAVLSEDGEHWIMNGSKIWISGGGLADIFTVFAQTPCFDEKTGKTKDKITAFVVERGFGGVTNGPPEDKMGIKCSNTVEVFFEDVKIPKNCVLGEVGEGFKVAMNILNNGRFGMGAALTGTMKSVIKTAVEFAAARTQFGSKIDTYGAIQEKIARMSMLCYVTESIAYMVAGNMDMGSTEYQIEAAISKIFASEAAWYCTDEAIQILGGMGYMRGSGVERFMRDLRIFRIFEGTNDILRLFTALTGIQHAGGHLKELQKALQDPLHNFGLIATQASSRAKRLVGMKSATNLAPFVHSNLAESATRCSQSIDEFGFAVEQLLIKHGKNIIHEQFLLNRVAESAIDIYAMTCALSRATRAIEKGFDSADHETKMTSVWCYEASKRVKDKLAMLTSRSQLSNFKKMAEISKNVVANGGLPVQQHPLGF